VRVLPVEDTCALDVGAIESMAKALADKHLSEETKPTEARAMRGRCAMRGGARVRGGDTRLCVLAQACDGKPRCVVRIRAHLSASADSAHHSTRAPVSPQFAVRPETHSPHLKEGMTVGDLVRRVANVVPNKHTVRLVQPQKTILLMVVAVRACARACCAMREQRTRHVCTGVLMRLIVLHACSLLVLGQCRTAPC
jgi:hypothetical protein